MADVERILIVGGGIAGLCLATALHQRGFRAELVERSATWQASGSGILLHANGVRVLRALGLAEAVEQAGAVLHLWNFSDQQGEVLYETDLRVLWGEVGSCVGISRPRLHRVLQAGAAAVPYRLGTSLTWLAQDGQQVSVGFSDGKTDTYDLVVGADGIASTVRKLLLGESPLGYTGLMDWRSLVPTRPPGVTKFQVLLGDGSVFGLCPLGDGQTYGFGVIGAPRLFDPLSGRLERFCHQFATFGGPVQAYLSEISSDEQLHCAPIEWVELDRWYVGRVVLIGDAAHASPPSMAEGGCLAMESAYVLAEALQEEDSVEKALESYVRRCKPRADWVLQQTRAISENLLRTPAIRDAVFRERGHQMMCENFRPLIPTP